MKAFYISQKHQMIVLPKHEADLIAHVIPHRVMLAKSVIVPHNMVETRLLNNIGYEIPSPIYYYYHWQNSQNFTPFASQVETAAFLTLNRRSFVLNDMGTGKTLSALWAMDFMMHHNDLQKALIISPLSTVNLVWSDTIWKNIKNRSFVVLTGNRKKRLKLLAENHDFYIINPEGIAVIFDDLMKRSDIEHLVIDEIAEYHNTRTQKHKYLTTLIKKGKTAWGMTGTPTPNEPTEAYGQVKLINPENVPRYFKAFRAQTMDKISEFRWVAKANAQSIVHTVMQPAIRYSRDDCYDLPDATYVDLEVELSQEQTRVYNEMHTSLITEVSNGEIRAANEGVKMSKLLQIAGGMAYDSEGIAQPLPCSKRLAELKSVITNAGTKVIVFVPFTAMTHMVADFLRKDFSVAVVNGAVNLKKRGDIFHAFQTTADPHVLVAHPKCMSHGLTLTEASTIIWYAPYANAAVYTQANGRISRTPQKNNQYYVHLQATELERRVFQRLRNKQSMQGALLEMFENAA